MVAGERLQGLIKPHAAMNVALIVTEALRQRKLASAHQPVHISTRTSVGGGR